MVAVLLGWILSASAVEPSDPTGPPVVPRVRTEVQGDGSVRVVPDRQVPADGNRADSVVLEFGDVTLYDLSLFFADVLHKNLLLVDAAGLRSKTVRLVGHEQMTVDEAWEVFRSALHRHGFTTAEEGGVVTIVSTENAARGPTAEGDGYVTRLLRIENAVAADLVTVAKPFLSEHAELIAYAPSNTLIVTDTAANVDKIAELVDALDIAAPQTTLALVHLQHAVAAELQKMIEVMYLTPEATEAHKPAPKTPRGARAPKPEPVVAAGEVARHVSRILSDARTNTLVVLANAEGHAAVAELVAELDVDTESSERKRLHVIHLNYALAEEVAAVVTQLQSRATEARPAAVRPKPNAEQAPREAEPTFDGDARIAADPTTNSLAIVADPDEYEAIAELVSELDIARRQVFVDAVFVELTSTGGQELGLGAHILPGEDSPGLFSAQLDPTQGMSSFAVTPDLLSGLAAGVFGPAIEVLAPDGSLLSVPTFGIALRALQVNSDIQVMGNPALLALDHQEATLTVGRKIPFQSSTSANVVGLPIQTFERLDVAMELRVTPHLNDEDLVTLDLVLSVDEVEGASAESALAGGPVTSSRSVESRVMVDDGQTIVIAGVTGTKLQRSETRVPILGDIPLLGLFFRGQQEEERRTHLMVFLTPYVVDRPSDLLAISMLKEAQRAEFVRRFQGKRGEEWLLELESLFASASEAASDSEKGAGGPSAGPGR